MLNSLINSFAGLNGLWAKLQGVALKVVGLAGVLSGASQLLLEVAKAIQDKSAPEILALVKAASTGQDPAVIAIGVGLAALGLHGHLTNITAATGPGGDASVSVKAAASMTKPPVAETPKS